MKAGLLIILTVIIYFLLGCSQIKSLDTEPTNSNSIIDLQNQIEELEKENDLLNERFQELDKKLDNYNLVKNPQLINQNQKKL